MAHFGRAGLTMNSFAIAIRMSPATIRRHFPDIDSILAEILLNHLQTISKAIGDVPLTTPNRKAAQRAAYIAATRTAYSAPTETHLLLIRERFALPQDLADIVETTRDVIGTLLGADQSAAILAILDTPTLQPPQIEAMLAGLAGADIGIPEPPITKPKPDFIPNKFICFSPKKPSQPQPSSRRARAGPH
jgi:AcrR family transcriptional regulator